MELDDALREQSLVVLNGPNQPRDKVNEELDIQVSLIKSVLYQIDTTEGPVLTRTLSENGRPIIFATPDEVREYYCQFAVAVLDRKKGSCVGLASVALFLSRSLLTKDHYKKIEIQICQLRHWSHAFVRFVHPKEPHGLFYDPWYQRCHTEHPEIPLLIEEHAFASKMERMIDHAVLQKYQTILRIKFFMEYDLHKQVLTGEMKTNRGYNFDYSILCSTKRFSNPVKTVPEPKGKTTVLVLHQNRSVSTEDTLVESRDLGCICS